MRGGGGRGRGRGRGSDKSLQQPDLIGQTLSEVGAAGGWASVAQDKPPPLFPETLIREFSSTGRDIDEREERFMLSKIEQLHAAAQRSALHVEAREAEISALLSSGTATAAAPHADSGIATSSSLLPAAAPLSVALLARKSFARAERACWSALADVRYTDLFPRELVDPDEDATLTVAGRKRKLAAAVAAATSKRAIAALVARVAPGEQGGGDSDDGGGEEGDAKRREFVEEDEENVLSDEEEELESDEDNDYNEAHDDDGDDGDEGGGGGGDD